MQVCKSLFTWHVDGVIDRDVWRLLFRRTACRDLMHKNLAGAVPLLVRTPSTDYVCEKCGQLLMSPCYRLPRNYGNTCSLQLLSRNYKCLTREVP